jgi:hypothetical protein
MNMIEKILAKASADKADVLIVPVDLSQINCELFWIRRFIERLMRFRSSEANQNHESKVRYLGGRLGSGQPSAGNLTGGWACL